MGKQNLTQFLDSISVGASCVDPSRFGLVHKGGAASRQLINTLFTLQSGAYSALLDWEVDQDLMVVHGDPVTMQSREGGELLCLHQPTPEELARQPKATMPQGVLQDANVVNRLLSAAAFVDPTHTPRTMALVSTVLRLCDRVLVQMATVEETIQPCRTTTLTYALATFLRELHGSTLSHAAYAADEQSDLCQRLETEAASLCAEAAALPAAAGSILGRRLAQYLAMRMGLGPAVPSLAHFSALSWLRGFDKETDKAQRQTAYVPLVVVPVSEALATYWRGCVEELRALPPRLAGTPLTKEAQA